MADKFDPYREALVMEETTVWPEEYGELSDDEKRSVAQALHAEPQNCSQLAYLRVHTGFCRQITVTADDYERVAA